MAEDAGARDGAIVGSQANCGPPADKDTLALFTFDGPKGGQTIVDLTGNWVGYLRGTGFIWLTGRDGCGYALGCMGDEKSYVEIPNNATLEQLKEGSIEFWLRLDKQGLGYEQGILSRDAKGTVKPGHFSVWVVANKVCVQLLPPGKNKGYKVYSPQITSDTWYHVGINFGPPTLELYLDGKLVGKTSNTSGIDGNQNPLVIGAGTWLSEEGAAEPIISTLIGDIDQLHFRSARRAFDKMPRKTGPASPRR